MGVLGAGAVLVLVHGVLAPAGEVRVEVVGPNEVLDVQERGARSPYVGVMPPGPPGGHGGDLPEHDVADASVVRVPLSLDVQLGNDAVFDERDPGFSDV